MVEDIIKNKKIGRPIKPIDLDKVFALSSIFCTQEEIAANLDISVSKLKASLPFLAAYKKGMEHGRSSLRSTLFRHSKENFAAAIFLSKQPGILGYTDRQINEQSGQITFKVVYDKPKDAATDPVKIEANCRIKELPVAKDAEGIAASD